MENFTAQLVENPGDPYDFWAFLGHKLSLVYPYVENLLTTAYAFIQGVLPNLRFIFVIISVFLFVVLLLVISRLARALHNHRKLKLFHLLGFRDPKNEE